MVVSLLAKRHVRPFFDDRVGRNDHFEGELCALRDRILLTQAAQKVEVVVDSLGKLEESFYEIDINMAGKVQEE